MKGGKSTVKNGLIPRTQSFLLFLTLLFISGCGGCGLKKIPETVENTTDKTLASLNDAIDALNTASSDWQDVLKDLSAKLTDDAQSTIRNEVNNLISRGIATAGGEFRCDVDFLRNRMKQELQRIKAQLLGADLDPLEPVLCQVVPPAVDISLVPSRLNKLEFFGYDFDHGNTRVFLVNNNVETDVSRNLDQPTHYHMTLNLGSNGVVFTPGSSRLILRFGDQEISTIGVIQPRTKICETRLVNHTPGRLTLIPKHTRGDREYSGNGPDVSASVRLINYGTSVKARVTMTARETKSDWTTASETKTFTIYTPDPGFRVNKIIGETLTSFRYTDNDHALDTYEQGSGGPVKRFVFMGDGSGNDAGIHTRVEIDFNRLRFELLETGDCVNEQSIRALEEMKLIKPEILKSLKISFPKLLVPMAIDTGK